MDWKTSLPKKPNFYWAISERNLVTIFKRSGKSGVWSFGGDSVPWKSVKAWGEAISAPPAWSSQQPTEEGWYSVKYDDKSVGVVRVAMGSVPHCYDFDIPSEIDIKKITSWFGPLVSPSPPKN